MINQLAKFIVEINNPGNISKVVVINELFSDN
jgi:hypothetical protein